MQRRNHKLAAIDQMYVTSVLFTLDSIVKIIGLILINELKVVEIARKISQIPAFLQSFH